MGAVTSGTRSSVSPYAVFDRASWRALAAGLAAAAGRGGAARAGHPRRPDRPRRGRDGLPAAGRAARPARRRQPPALGRAERSSSATRRRRCRSSSPSPAASPSARARPPGCCRPCSPPAPGSPRVDLVTTDGFLLPNAVLESRGLLGRKGFPESYDRRALLRFLADVKSGRERCSRRSTTTSPTTSSRAGGRRSTGPTSSCVEGLNVLQAGRRTDGTAPGGVPVGLLRLLRLRRRRRGRHPAAGTSSGSSRCAARRSRTPPPTSTVSPRSPTSRRGRPRWASGRRSTGPNLRDNIAPTRSRARLVLQKANDHSVRRVLLRKL